jgi:hypothetical protein
LAKEEILEEGKKEEKEEEEKEVDEGVETYLRVLKDGSYVVPERADVVEAIEKLFLKEEGKFAESGSGVELVWLQLPFPAALETGSESYRTYDVSKEPAHFREDCDGISQARSKPAHRGRGADSGGTL